MAVRARYRGGGAELPPWSAKVPYGCDEAGHRNVLVSVPISLGDPLPNLVLMYSCDVFGAAAAAAFGIDENSVDKASLAFDQKAYLYLVPGNTEPCRTGTRQGRASG
ncbi:MAG: hypothetical protein IT207_02580 [Fimbriimonadaceae bacterium]|nr:hypothetical protein [Fimbriimonadaceae bacterium]